jgi:hypothetical protein
MGRASSDENADDVAVACPIPGRALVAATDPSSVARTLHLLLNLVDIA